MRVDRSGRPKWDGLKHPHAVTYAGLAFLLAEPHLPPGESGAWAKRALGGSTNLQTLVLGGSFRRNNERYNDSARLPTPDGRDIMELVPGFKEINTQGDAIALLTCFAERDSGRRHVQRLAAMVDLVANRLVQPNGVLPCRYLSDWRPVPDLARVGYLRVGTPPSWPLLLYRDG